MSDSSKLHEHTSVVGGMRHYRVMWLILLVLGQAGAIVFGLSFFAGVGLDFASALLCLLGPIVLGVTLFVAGEPGALDVKPRKPKKPRTPRVPLFARRRYLTDEELTSFPIDEDRHKLLG